jgi:outer membrane protein assembly factor BamB
VFDGKIWVVGGQQCSSGTVTNQVWYSTDGGTWTQASSPTWTGRYQHSAITFDNKIFVMGGFTGGSNLHDVWFSPDGQNWTASTFAAPWVIRSGHTSVVFNQRMWVLGGVNFDASLSDVWYSDLINLLSPNGGEFWAGGSSRNITWQSIGPFSRKFTLLYSTDAGMTFPFAIADSVPPTSTSYFWTLPSINSSTARVKLQWKDSINQVLSDDMSDFDFEIDSWPPAHVSDLHAVDKTYNSIALQWTAPGDDSLSGLATQYDVRYSSNLITPSNFNSATPAPNIPVPSPPLTAETFVVTNLATNARYYFAMKTRDNAGNLSSLSNVHYDSTAQVPILATSQYPMFRYNNQHTGRSPYHGAVSPTLAWFFQTSGAILGSPIVGTDSTIYVPSTDGFLYAVRPNGTEIWRYPLGAPASGTPAVALGGNIYTCAGEYLYAIRPNGTLRWSFRAPSGVISTSPALGSDGAIYFGSTNDSLYAIYADGTVKWKYRIGSDVLSSPTISVTGTIFVGASDGKLYSLSSSGTLNWAFTSPAPIISSPTVGLGDTLYFGSTNGRLYAINPNGTAKWAYQTGDTITSSPAVGADGTIYIGSYDRRTYAIFPNGTRKWSYTTSGKIRSSPTIDAFGALYVGSDDGYIYALRQADSTLIWSSLTGGAIRSSPAISANGTVLIGSNDQRMYAFGPGPVSVDETHPLIPGKFQLRQNYPNPFNPSTTIEYDVPVASHIMLKVFDLLGREIATLLNSTVEPGSHHIIFNAPHLASGIYLYRIEAGEFVQTNKLLIIR